MTTDYGLEHVNAVIRVFGLSRFGCAKPNHPGEHMNNLKAVSEDDAFLSKVGPLCEAVGEWFQSRPDKPFVAVFVCKEGRHRSVTASRLWAELCRRKGFTVSLRHLCHWNWWGCRGKCAECDHAAPGKKAFFDNFAVNLDCLW